MFAALAGPGPITPSPAWPPAPGHGIADPTEISRTQPELVTLPEPLVLKSPMLLVRYVINANGTVGKVSVVRSCHPLVDRAWVAAIKSWRYRPCTKAGSSVACTVTMTVFPHAENWPRQQ